MGHLARARTNASSRITEERLEEIRNAAATGPALVPAPGKKELPDYYGVPLLKAPTWTWEVPLYFFLGGLAGAAANIAFIASFSGRASDLIRPSLWIALIAAGLCPPLLISDLGRPGRFLNMLRVFKWRSPMSVGAWALSVFTAFAMVALVANELVRSHASGVFVPVRLAAGAGAAMTGLILASYTGVLLAVTAVPGWSENRRLLPAHFVASAAGSAGCVLELLGYLVPATQALGLVSSAVESLVGLSIEVKNRPVNRPLVHGPSGRLLRVAGFFEGPLPFLLRVFWGSTSAGRLFAAAFFIAGTVATRYAWIMAGRASAQDPQQLLALQQTKKFSLAERRQIS